MMDAANKVTFPGYYTSLVKIAEFIRTASQEAGFDSATSYHIELAIDEAVTNIIEHAYGGEGVGEIECMYQVDHQGLTIQIRDHGQPFLPHAVATPNITAPLKKRDNHGLGLFLIKQLMDEVSFDFEPTVGNTLTLVKHKEQD